jgi:hypothetical protein
MKQQKNNKNIIPENGEFIHQQFAETKNKA